MLFCTKCGAGWAYLPFYGPPECVNPECEHFSFRHSEIINKEIQESISKNSKNKKSDEEEDDLTNYYSPVVGMFFSDKDD